MKLDVLQLHCSPTFLVAIMLKFPQVIAHSDAVTQRLLTAAASPIAHPHN